MLIFGGVCALQANAQATRTWVSGVGDDANPCSRTAPCKTLAGAISKTADNGEINAIDSGGFGAVTITKNITIDLSSVLGGVLASGTTGIIVNDGGAGSIVVTLRGMDINGFSSTGPSPSPGVRIISAKSVQVENSSIYGFNKGISDERTAGGSLFVSNSIIRNNSNTGIALSTASNPLVKAFIDNTQVRGSVAGISVANGNIATVTNSIIYGNTSYGIVAFGTGTAVAVKNSSITGNATGIGITNGNPIIRISNLLITQNTTSLSVSASSTGQILSFGDNKISGNAVDNGPTGTILQQ